MLKNIKLSLFIIGTIALFFKGISYSLGWFLGFLALYLLAFLRKNFYDKIFSQQTFAKNLYIQYLILVFVVLWTAPILAFIFPEKINPFTLIATYFIDRLLLFVSNIFKKESDYVSD